MSLERLLVSNDAPSSHETPSIYQQINVIDSEIRALDSRIHDTQILLAQLQESRSTKLELSNKWRGSVSAVRHLAPETIGEILSWSLPSIVTRSSVYKLCQISRLWRESAFATQSLWTSLRIGKSMLPERIYPTIIEWQGRAGILPLSLSIDSPFEIPDEILELLVPLSGRCRALDLTSFDSPIFHQLVANPEANWGFLETLCLSFGSADELSLSALGASAQRLRSVTLKGLGPPWRKQILRLPLRQLKELSIQFGLFARDALSILAECHSLETCEMWLREVNHPGPSPIPAHNFITLPSLASFSISAAHRVDLSSLLNHLILPALKKLAIGVSLPRLRSAMVAFPVEDFLSFLQRSQPMLQELRLLSGSFRTADFVECMRKIRTLRVLEVVQNSGIYFEDTALMEFAKGIGFLPNLAHLKVTGGDKFRDSLIQFIKARWSAHKSSTLQSVRVSGNSEFGSLAALKKGGFDLELDL